MLDARLGEDSPFHTAFGFYVEGIHKDVVVLPTNWDNRLVHFVVDDDASSLYGRAGLCLDPVDLCVAKTIAGREKDYEFVAALVAEQLVTAADIQARIAGGIDWPPTYTENKERSLARAQSWLDYLSSSAAVRPDGSATTPTSPPTAGPDITAALLGHPRPIKQMLSRRTREPNSAGPELPDDGPVREAGPDLSR